MLTIRCSSLDRIAACPSAATPPTTVIDWDSEPARMGNAVDDYLTGGGELTVESLAVKYRLDEDDVRRACGTAKAAWASVGASIPDPWFHPSLPAVVDAGRGITLTGTPDLVAMDGDTLYVLDFKSGWADGDHWHQVTGYARLAMAFLTGVKQVVLMVLHTRLGVIDRRDLTAQQVNDWWDAFADRIKSDGDRHSPGKCCTYCPRSHECTARADYVRSAIATITDNATAIDTQPEAMALGLERVRMIEAACEHYRKVVKSAVASAGGSLDIGDGRELVITREERREIDFIAGQPVIEAHAPVHWRTAIRVSKSQLEKIVGDAAPKRGKGKAIKALMDDLDQNDAIKLTTTERLEIRKAAKQLEAVQ